MYISTFFYFWCNLKQNRRFYFYNIHIYNRMKRLSDLVNEKLRISNEPDRIEYIVKSFEEWVMDKIDDRIALIEDDEEDILALRTDFSEYYDYFFNNAIDEFLSKYRIKATEIEDIEDELEDIVVSLISDTEEKLSDEYTWWDRTGSHWDDDQI